MAQLMPAGEFVAQLEAALNRRDGYIMGARGQAPSGWAEDSWWYAQYSGAQREKALYWRANAARVWDCNGLAEGIYEDFAGININTKARYNYAQWCSVKGTGIIPSDRRVPGAAVFWGDKVEEIHHVAYLYRPVVEDSPDGDWYLIEARGVMYGVVRTRLLERRPDYWGWMDRYFDYANADVKPGAEHEHMLRIGAQGRWNVRLGPGTEYGVITVASCGDEFEHIAQAHNGWHCIRLEGKVGWVSDRCAEVI